MTATALAIGFGAEPELDYFDDADGFVPCPPQLRVIEGGRRTTTTSHTEPAAVELYRRRRFVALVALTAVILLATQLAGISLLSLRPAAAAAVDTGAPAVHVVLPGDSYGAIAASFGAENPVAAAAQLQAANGGSELQVGERLVIPRGFLSGAVAIEQAVERP